MTRKRSIENIKIGLNYCPDGNCINNDIPIKDEIQYDIDCKNDISEKNYSTFEFINEGTTKSKDIFIVTKLKDEVFDRIHSFKVNNNVNILDIIENEEFFLLLIKDIFVFLRNQTNLLEYLSIDQLKKVPPLIYSVAKDIFSSEISVRGEGKFLKKISNLKGFIYLTTNLKTIKKYIGQTTRTIEKEWGSILTKAGQLKKKREKSSQPIQGRYIFNAVIKYGREEWELDLIDIAYCQSDLDEKEIYYIAKYKTNALRYNNPSFGYNMTDGGSGGNQAPETIEKIRESVIEYWQKRANREKMSKITKEVWKRDGHRERMSKIQSGVQKKRWEKARANPKILEKMLDPLRKIQENKIIPINNKKQFLVDIKYSRKREDLLKYNMSGITISRKIKQILGAFGVNNYKSAKIFLDDRNVDEVFKYLDNPKDYSMFKDPAIKEFFKDVIDSTTSSDLFSKYGYRNITRTKIPRIVGNFGITNYTELKKFFEEKGLTESLKYFESIDRISIPKSNLTNEERLDEIAEDKNLTLLSPYDDYKDTRTELRWLCNVCGNEFNSSPRNVKRAKMPCNNCRSLISKRHY